MVSSVSVVVAEIVMQNIGERALATYKRTLPLWLRYVDDTFTTVHRQTDRQTDRQADRQTETDRQTDSLYFSTIKIKALQLVGSCKMIKLKLNFIKNIYIHIKILAPLILF